MGGEWHEGVEAKTITTGSHSGRLSVSNYEMEAFQQKQRSAMPVADREQALFSQGFAFSGLADIYGRRDLLAEKPETPEVPRKAEREVPKVGQPVELKSFLEMDSPVGDACRSAKSRTLNSLASELEKRPWKVQAEFDQNARFQDYDPKNSLIRLGTAWDDERKVDSFAHEAYHGTHQDLDKLYGSQKPVSKEQYLKIKMDEEAGAFLAEFRTNRELGHKNQTSYEWADGTEVRHQNIGNLIVYKETGGKKVIDEAASKAAIGAFLQEHHAPVRNANGWVERDSWTGAIHTTPYPKQYADSYEQYKSGFDQDRKMLVDKKWLGKGY